MATVYKDAFYQKRKNYAASSAAALVPLLIDLFKPRTVLDVGCGDGAWLQAFERLGGCTVCGVDGPWSPAGQRLGADKFVQFDLGARPISELKLPIERFDLVISFEFLEHVEAAQGRDIVRFICEHAGAAVCGAAAPHQGGTHHVNEQYPDYWAALFEANGFKAYDFLRYAVWDNEAIKPWYRQNIVGYFPGGPPQRVRDFAQASIGDLLERPRALCHPGVFGKKLGLFRSALKNPLKTGLQLLKEEIAKRG